MKIKKAVLLSVLILSLAFFAVGCKQSESDRVVGATSEAACLAKAFLDEFNPQDLIEKAKTMTPEEIQKLQEDAQTKQTEIQENMTKILSKYGFKDEVEFQEIAKKYENDEAVKEATKTKAKESCGMDLDEFEKLMKGV